MFSEFKVVTSVDELNRLQSMIQIYSILFRTSMGSPDGGNPKNLGSECLSHSSSVGSQGSGNIRECAKDKVRVTFLK